MNLNYSLLFAGNVRTFDLLHGALQTIGTYKAGSGEICFRSFFMPFNCVASSQVKDSASQNRDRTRQSKQASLKTATGPDADRATRPNLKDYQGVAVTDKQVLCDKWWYSTGLLATYCS